MKIFKFSLVMMSFLVCHAMQQPSPKTDWKKAAILIGGASAGVAIAKPVLSYWLPHYACTEQWSLAIAAGTHFGMLAASAYFYPETAKDRELHTSQLNILNK